MTLEEHLVKISGAKDIQIAALLSQIDTLRDQVTKLAAKRPEDEPLRPDSAVKPNGRSEPVAPPS
jgi:hypothetical protein